MAPDTCPMCGHTVAQPGARFCDNCGTSLSVAADGAGAGPQGGGDHAAEEPLPPPPPPPPPPNSVPFEDRSRPFWERLSRTVGRAISDPMGLFSNLSRGDIGPPLIYGLLVGTVATVFSVLWNMAFGSLLMFAPDYSASDFALGTVMNVVIMVLSPLLVGVSLFVSAGIYHVVLLLLGDGKRGFAVTFRAVSYGSTPQLLAVVPICGGIVGGIWSVVLFIVGAYLGHGTEWWRALLAYFLPAVVCCCFVIWLFVSLGFLGAFNAHP